MTLVDDCRLAEIVGAVEEKVDENVRREQEGKEEIMRNLIKYSRSNNNGRI
jgi:hypothetical protein